MDSEIVNATSTHCPNCGTDLQPTNAHQCSQCGNPIIAAPPGWSERTRSPRPSDDPELLSHLDQKHLSARKCVCGGRLVATRVEFKIPQSALQPKRPTEIEVNLECTRCPLEISMPEPKMVAASAFLLFTFAFLSLIFVGFVLPNLGGPHTPVVWLTPIGIMTLVGFVSWIGYIFYRGTVYRFRYPKLPDRGGNSIEDSRLDPGAKRVREMSRAKRNQLGLQAQILGCAVAAICGIGYQWAVYVDYDALKNIGVRTEGTLERVSITKHFPLFWLKDYVFDVKFAEQSGRTRSASIAADEELFSKHTLPSGQFTHHALDVIYHPTNPGLNGFPDHLSYSYFGYFLLALSITVGWFCLKKWRNAAEHLRMLQGG